VSRDNACVQLFPVVHKHKQYFNWFIALYMEQDDEVHFGGKYSTLYEVKYISMLSSSMTSYNYFISSSAPLIALHLAVLCVCVHG